VKFTCWKGVVTCIVNHGSEDGLFKFLNCKFLKCGIYIEIFITVKRLSMRRPTMCTVNLTEVHHGWVCSLMIRA
jgi:hypothetical protein